MKVVFLQRMLPDYKVPLFKELQIQLAEFNIEFYLVYGQMRASDGHREGVIKEFWAKKIRNLYIYKDLHYPILDGSLKNANLVIVQQESSYLINFELILRSLVFSTPKVAFFGHGKNMKVHGKEPLKEKFKKWYMIKVDWWFPYTDLSKRFVLAAGFPNDRLTVVNNTIDTVRLQMYLQSITKNEKKDLRCEIGLNEDDCVGIFCGRFRPEKIGILIQAAKEIRMRVDNFKLIIIGSGQLEGYIERFAVEYDWVKYVGAKFERDQAKYLTISDVFLMPGLVGLAILDAFTAGLPLFTTDCKIHSPEIEYLKNSYNGYKTIVDSSAYADVVAACLKDKKRLRELSSNAIATSSKLSIKNSAALFTLGIENVLRL